MPPDLQIICPKCRKPMVERIAGRGPNRGNPFWACPGFPACKGTRPKGGTAAVVAAAPQQWTAYKDVDLASTTADGVSLVHQATFVPRAALAHLVRHGDPGLMRALSQWASDWSHNNTKHGEDSISTWLPIVWKIMNRGSVLPLPPDLEKALRDELGDPEGIATQDWQSAVYEVAARADDTATLHKSGFDSDEEKTFYQSLLPSLTPPGLMRIWQKQVPLDSLLNGNEEAGTDRRVDFLFLVPKKLQLVVEIDGSQHEEAAAQAVDASRDDALVRAGFQVVRIPTAEVSAKAGPCLETLKALLAQVRGSDVKALSSAARWLLAGQVAMQVQMSLLNGLKDGSLPCTPDTALSIAVASNGAATGFKLPTLAEAAIQDFGKLCQDVATCLGCASPPHMSFAQHAKADFTIGFSETPFATVAILAVQLPCETLQPTTAFASSQMPASSIDRASTERLLLRVFGHSDFREGQFEAIERVVAGRDTIVLLPTGAGKSVVFQLASLLRLGPSLIVAPLNSLIDDQVVNLQYHGIDRAVGVTTMSLEHNIELLARLARGHYWLCYITPERLQSDDFRQRLSQLTTYSPVALVAVDEVHCVSEWGHDFRPAYLTLSKVARTVCAFKGVSPPLIGLTGTASRSVLKDVQRSLEITGAASVITPQSFDRPELTFEIQRCSSRNKPNVLFGVLERVPQFLGILRQQVFNPRNATPCAGLIFCVHVVGKYGIMDVSQAVRAELHCRVEPFGSKTPDGRTKADWMQHLRKCSRDFKQDTLPLMVCTSAFGMGIDKPNVRYSVHYNLPKSIEAFYQEAGRTGRNRAKSLCVIIVSDDDPVRADAVLTPRATRREIMQSIATAKNNGSTDDVLRNLYFHNGSFGGDEEDRDHVRLAIRGLKIDGVRARRAVSFNLLAVESGQDAEKKVEHALQRLLTIGVVSDYTKDYPKKQFMVDISGDGKDSIIEALRTYVATYQRQRAQEIVDRVRKQMSLEYPDFVMHCAAALIEFVYDVVERGRRQALSEMLRVCRTANSDAEIRRGLLQYLERSQFSEILEEIVNAERAGCIRIRDVFAEVASQLDASELRAQCGRMLNDYPDQPAVRILLAGAEGLSEAVNEKAVIDNVAAAINDGLVKYQLTQGEVCDMLSAVMEALGEQPASLLYRIMQAGLGQFESTRLAARTLMVALPTKLRHFPKAVLVKGVADRLNSVL